MDTERHMERVEPGLDPSLEKPVPAEWQFSLRGLLVTTTIVSICLAIGTYFKGIAFAVFAMILFQVAFLLSMDWLIRPANRRMLAFVAAGFWIVAGSSLLTVSGKLAWDRDPADDWKGVWVAIAFLTLAAPLCYWFAWRRWKHLTR